METIIFSKEFNSLIIGRILLKVIEEPLKKDIDENIKLLKQKTEEFEIGTKRNESMIKEWKAMQKDAFADTHDHQKPN